MTIDKQSVVPDTGITSSRDYVYGMWEYKVRKIIGLFKGKVE